MKVVLDTNVLVSALLNPFGPPARVFDLFMTGSLQLAFDDRILAECREVLARPRFGFDVDDVSELLEYLQVGGILVAASPLPNPLPVPDDEPFLEVAVAARVEALITGNIRHYPVEIRHGISILSPSDFIAWWQSRQQAQDE
ncbi:MAG TPA: putative toxin-antitoxin system toxin component, PIN family [Anaerolineae bacterium]|nr:putative toxin-antitoxin system toxin component, PIN family [Anaerolineae bacterium]